MLTAKSQEMDKISGLMTGADDYITKPFNILEVKARIKAIMRRSEKKEAPIQKTSRITEGDITVDLDSKRFFVNGKEISLTTKEFELFYLMMQNPGKIYSRQSLLTTVWGDDYPGDERTVDVHVRRLREKIEDVPAEPKYVHTKWGAGYYYQQ